MVKNAVKLPELMPVTTRTSMAVMGNLTEAAGLPFKQELALTLGRDRLCADVKKPNTGMRR
ncbi:MAG: hypothetical protein ACHBN1_11145 [Heteroscytonema crispum UTEX LB 1556]